MKSIYAYLLFFFCYLSFSTQAQTIHQKLYGKVVDKTTRQEVIGVAVWVNTNDKAISCLTDERGNFVLHVPIGRHDVFFKLIGYTPYVAKEIIINSAKEYQLNIALTEETTVLNEIEVTYVSSKDETNNSMAFVSGRKFTVEETSRYAGGFDDPARLASSFAGVAGETGSNGMVVRGNSPKGMLWRVEGVDIPDPNHLSNIIAFGGGSVTALSNHVLDNSDFYTGAFAAEYGNALAGVFDLSLRNGSTDDYAFATQVGINGIDLAAEGPLKKGTDASFLFNYRYSTYALLSPILPPEMGFLGYQDLSFKLNIPTSKNGTLSIWGVGGQDTQHRAAESDSSTRTFEEADVAFKTNILFGGTGINYQHTINKSGYWKTSLSASGNSMFWEEGRLNNENVVEQKEDFENTQWNLALNSYINYQFGKKHTNRTGFTVKQLHYTINMNQADDYGEPMYNFANGTGTSYLLQGYTQSQFNLGNHWTLNAGLHLQYFDINKEISIEPRVGARYQINPWHGITLGYGLHSQIEQLHYYMLPITNNEGTTTYPNNDLGFSKAHHFVVGYDWNISESLRFKSEIFYQHLFNIPVVDGSYFSMQNITNEWYIPFGLENTGTGKNVGIDLTLEQFIKNGFYFLTTASIFDSKYTGGDGIEREAIFNKNYVFNFLAGKEWKVGKKKNNTFSMNGKITFMGGDRKHPLDEEASNVTGEIVYDYQNAYGEQYPSNQILSMSFLYQRNKPTHTSLWTFQIINALGNPEYFGYTMTKEGKIEENTDTLVLPNIAYKIIF
ncbi:prevent-host-death protein [Flammeovirga pectinis]|uniref:Prevent-host-death protein n=1 Tax=Flammeovirga pectinis TaxID=2494373 RepID=A0A3S9PAT8_9BACT|nr:TonB-dependent receptor [Flammeovirga pectinis]AZQ65259.1 prevent-host-death protein [Flammeovirga pectinis]